LMQLAVRSRIKKEMKKEVDAYLSMYFTS
jgi:hypothetical protein